MARKLTKEDGIHAIYGGCILGGGGGGIIKEGLNKLDEAFKRGAPVLKTVDEFANEDVVVCVSLVGAPSAKDMFLSDEQTIDAVKRMQAELDAPVAAIMTNENGAATTTNGWLQAAALGLPILDAPSNGRAHPTGSMGSMNLSEDKSYRSIQAFAGGKNERAIEGIVAGSLGNVSDTMRELSVKAGGLVGVCRNPVSIKYVKENASAGAITQAIELGEVLLSANEGKERIEAAVNYLEGSILYEGKVTSFTLKKEGGFDVGLVYVDDLELTFWNEYMTAEINGVRHGTFPDLIMTLDTNTGLPIVSAEIEEGQDVAVIVVPKKKLILSTTMFNEKLLRVVEPIIQKKIL